MPTPTPPYQFIAIARTIARGFTEQAIGRPDGEALTEAAQANWRGIEVLPRRVHPRYVPTRGTTPRASRGRATTVRATENWRSGSAATAPRPDRRSACRGASAVPPPRSR